MPVANPKKTVSVSSMRCGGTATVTISFDSAASLALKPADIVLIMDRSAGLTQEKMTYAKSAAIAFIDMVDGARDGTTRMGMVSFSDDATVDVAINDNFSMLKPAVNALTAGGHANYKAAFEAAGNLLNIRSSHRQIIVLFTQGKIAGSEATDAVVQELKAKGIEIFCIGLSTGSVPLNQWATDPDSIHVAHTEDPTKLEYAFQKIAAEVILAGARDVVIGEQLAPDFQIAEIHGPSVGTAQITGAQTLTWTIDATGLRDQPTTARLSFVVRHIGKRSGLLPVNHSISYSDREGNTLDFPVPSVEVTCSGTDIYPEPCPQPAEFTIFGCQDAAHFSVADVFLQGLGRIAQVDVTLKAVCPGKRVAVSILLTELSPEGKELPRGVKHILVPAQTGDVCQDLTLKCIQFSLPEALDASGSTDSICNPRQFAARVIANYIDSDFVCCQEIAEIS